MVALLALLAAFSASAAEMHELTLRGGGTILAREVEHRDGRWHLVSSSGLPMSLPESRVLSVRPLEKPTRSPGLGIHTEGARDSGPRPEPAALRERDLESFRSVERLRALRAFRDAELLLREELVDRPGDPLRLVLLGRVLVDAGRYREALEPLGSCAPPSHSTLGRERALALAEAHSHLDRVDEALSALASVPEDSGGEVAAMRARLERDLEAVGELDALTTPRFLVRLPAGHRRPSLKPLLGLLEQAFAELEARLGGAPRERVVVLIQPGREFWETTGMGRNVGGLYDGKVRVPAGRIDPPSPRLAAVLRHELSHAFVDALTDGRADHVWQEGIAEHFEGSARNRELEARLAEAHRSGRWPPPYDHATAHSRLEWFLSRWGESGLRDLLREWSRRGSIDGALLAVTGLDEDELEDAWGASLAAARGR